MKWSEYLWGLVFILLDPKKWVRIYKALKVKKKLRFEEKKTKASVIDTHNFLHSLPIAKFLNIQRGHFTTIDSPYGFIEVSVDTERDCYNLVYRNGDEINKIDISRYDMVTGSKDYIHDRVYEMIRQTKN